MLRLALLILVDVAFGQNMGGTECFSKEANACIQGPDGQGKPCPSGDACLCYVDIMKCMKEVGMKCGGVAPEMFKVQCQAYKNNCPNLDCTVEAGSSNTSSLFPPTGNKETDCMNAEVAPCLFKTDCKEKMMCATEAGVKCGMPGYGLEMCKQSMKECPNVDCAMYDKPAKSESTNRSPAEACLEREVPACHSKQCTGNPCACQKDLIMCVTDLGVKCGMPMYGKESCEGMKRTSGEQQCSNLVCSDFVRPAPTGAKNNGETMTVRKSGAGNVALSAAMTAMLSALPLLF